MDSQPTVYVPPPQQRQQNQNNEVWVPVPPQRQRPFLTLFFWLVGLTLVGLIGLATLALVFVTSDWILPGTAVLGSNIGGQTEAEATAVL